MSAGRYDLVIEKGATFSRIFTWKIPSATNPTSCPPLNLTGYTARAQIRATVAAADPPAIDLTSSPAAGLVLGGVAGTITMTITAAQTSALTLTNNVGVWDIELTAPDSSVVRLLEGSVELRPDVTR